MSNAGQAVLGIVGAVVGFVIGGPTGAMYGAQLGLLAGSVLFPTQLPGMQGPRIGDGQQTVSVVGAPIPLIFGTQPVGGIIVWASPIREVATKQTAGKGGAEQEQTTYTYFRSFAILLCEGPIGGVRRIWANGKIIYDRSIPSTVDVDNLDQMSESVRALLTQLEAINSGLADKMTVYLGTEDQMPDPVIESFEGVGNVPAYRGYAMVVFNDVELKAEDGNRIPASWKFEVYEDADDTDIDLNVYSNEVLYPWISGNNPLNSLNVNEVSVHVGPSGLGTFDDVGDCMDAISSALGYEIDWILGSSSASNAPPLIDGENDVGDGVRAWVYVCKAKPDYFIEGNVPFSCDNPTPAMLIPGATWYNYGTQFRLTTAVLGSDNIGPEVPHGWDTRGRCTQTYWWFESSVRIIEIHRTPSPPQDPCGELTQSSGLPEGYGLYNGTPVSCGPWEFDDSQSYLVLQQFDGEPFTKYPLNPTLPVGHINDTEDSWVAAYEEAVALGFMEEDLVYGVDYPVTQAFGYRKARDTTIVDVNPVSLASIVARLCERSGLEQYDVSDLEDIYVVGYQVSRPMYTRAAIEPLRQVGFFDVIESGIELKFPTRGKVSVATLIDDDLAAHFVGEERPSIVTTTKKQDLELPRQIRVHYQNPQRDYDPGEEPSPARFDTAAESILDVELSVAISSDQAARIAEVLYRDTWASRWAHSISVDQSRSAIEPADIIIVPVDGQNQRMRVPTLTDRLINLRQMQLVRDDDGSYESTATGVTSQRPSNDLILYGPVELLILDLPALVDTDDDAGFYVAARPLITGGAFRGAVISRSVDGNTFTVVTSVTDATPVGFLTTALPEGPTTIFDEANELRVSLQYGELESRSEEDVLSGANAAAIGVDGRWEIVQFKDAVNVAGSVWSLTGLLRGRRGTEHAVGSSIAADRFVLLSIGTLSRVVQTVADIGLPREYKALVVGTGQGNVTATSFIGHGIALKPFSPVHVEATRDVDGNIQITWTRRDRLGSDIDVPMSEAVEDYEVDVLNADGVTLRTISVSEPLAAYSTAQQITDFGSLQPEGTVALNVYQISVAVGRGYPAEAIV